MNLPLVISRAFRRQFLPKHYHFIRNFSCKISTNVSMASQRLVWVDLEVRRLRFISSFLPFPLQNENCRETKRGGRGSGIDLLLCYDFCQNYDKIFQNHFDYKVDGLDNHRAAKTSYLLTSIRDGVFIEKYSHMEGQSNFLSAPVLSLSMQGQISTSYFLVSAPLKFAPEISKCC